MTHEERIAQLEQENAELRAKLAQACQQITQLTDQLQRVQGQLAKDSHNSSKPPSSDGESAQAQESAEASPETDRRATRTSWTDLDAGEHS
jgi:hypothetical protein